MVWRVCVHLNRNVIFSRRGVDIRTVTAIRYNNELFRLSPTFCLLTKNAYWMCYCVEIRQIMFR